MCYGDARLGENAYLLLHFGSLMFVKYVKNSDCLLEMSIMFLCC